MLPQQQGVEYGQVHLVGNSVGGLLATMLAARQPSRIRSVCLLNPTPVWGSNLPLWDGRLPGPAIPRAIGRWTYDRLRDPANIKALLEKTYARPAESKIDELGDKIRAVTDDSEGGHAAFASIMWCPPFCRERAGGASTFYDLLQRVQCDVLLLNGAEDPWCGPKFARAAMRALESRGTSQGEAAYVELTPAGHCVNHEAPEATNQMLTRWLLREGPLVVAAQGERFGDVTATLMSEIEPQSLWERALVRALV